MLEGGLFATLVALTVVVATVTVVVLAVLAFFARRNAQLEARLLGRDSVDAEFAGAGSPALLALAQGGKKVESWVDKDGETARLLVQAGWRGPQRRVQFYVMQAVLPLLAVGLAFALWTFNNGKIPTVLLPAYTFALFALAFLIPRWVLRSAATARRQKLAREVPLFVHLLVLLFEAGLSTRQAFSTLVREGRGVLPELGQEFEMLLRQLEAGGEVPVLLKSMGDALDVSDLTGILAVLRQVDRYGGEVREPLLEALAVLEERRGLDLREKVNLISGRMTVVMVLFFFPALLIFVAGPAALSILHALADVNAK